MTVRFISGSASRFVSRLALALTATVSVAQASDQAAVSDLTLPGAKWYGEFEGYVCDASETGFVPRPMQFNQMNVVFEKLVTDASLDHVLLTATFGESDAQCRYSAIFLADNAARTAKLVESRAFSLVAGMDCEAGQQILDGKLTTFEYLYYGHPHRVGIMMPFADAAELCDEGATAVAPAFVVKGRIQP